MRIFKNWLKRKPKEEKYQLKHVKAGSKINITIYGKGVAECEVFSNEPETQTICIILTYIDNKKEHKVVNYNNEYFRNFTLLNKKEKQISIKEILNEKIKSFEEKEEFEKCKILKNAIEIL